METASSDASQVLQKAARLLSEEELFGNASAPDQLLRMKPGQGSGSGQSV
jgi:hypothetical protein